MTKVSEFDEKFDAGESVMDMLDMSTACRPNLEAKRVNVDFPAWMVQSLDREANRIGVTRQSLIKMWLADRLGLTQTAMDRLKQPQDMNPGFHESGSGKNALAIAATLVEKTTKQLEGMIPTNRASMQLMVTRDAASGRILQPTTLTKTKHKPKKDHKRA